VVLNRIYSQQLQANTRCKATSKSKAKTEEVVGILFISCTREQVGRAPELQEEMEATAEMTKLKYYNSNWFQIFKVPEVKGDRVAPTHRTTKWCLPLA